MMSRHLKTTLKNFPIFRFSQTKANNTNNVINQDIANLLRIDSVKSVHVTKTGHPSSCASIAEIMSVLFFHEAGLKFHATNTKHFLNDRLVLSKGHAAPILYSVLYRAKIIS
jgi:transketolase